MKLSCISEYIKPLKELKYLTLPYYESILDFLQHLFELFLNVWVLKGEILGKMFGFKRHVPKYLLYKYTPCSKKP